MIGPWLHILSAARIELRATAFDASHSNATIRCYDAPDQTRAGRSEVSVVTTSVKDITHSPIAAVRLQSFAPQCLPYPHPSLPSQGHRRRPLGRSLGSGERPPRLVAALPTLSSRSPTSFMAVCHCFCLSFPWKRVAPVYFQLPPLVESSSRAPPPPPLHT